jgi:hypothetical protein
MNNIFIRDFLLPSNPFKKRVTSGFDDTKCSVTQFP